MSCRAIIQACIRKLKRNRDIGTHDYSYYAFRGEAPFITYVCRQAIVRQAIGSTDTFDDLVDTQGQEIKKLICRIDRYGYIYTSWLGQQAMPPGCQAEVVQKLDAWLHYYAPSQPTIRHDLEMALQQACAGYVYEQDLWVWALPVLGAELWQRATLPLHVSTEGNVNKLVVQNYLAQRTAVLLTCLRDQVGIYHIQPETVIARTQLLLLQTSKISFPTQTEMLAWVEARLCDQIKLQIPFHVVPNMSHEWGQNTAEDTCEQIIRRRFLEVFCDLVGGNGGDHAY
jgi:hypothetical protein